MSEGTAAATRRDDPVDERLATWIEGNLACRITAFERQKRWRPAWYIEVKAASGEHRSLYVRGHRPEVLDAAPFHREYAVLQVLEDEGIPVPHVHGLCPDPLAIVMDRAAGRADLSTAESDDERRSVLNHYIEVLAQVHQIDAAKFEKTGLVAPENPREAVLGQFNASVARFRNSKCRPEPAIEFLIRWVLRNAPLHRTKVSFLVCDVGQFMFDSGKLTAVLDLSLAYLGDALQDLAAFQFRNTSEPLGDIPSALRHYEKVTGELIDGDAFDFHAIAFSALTPLGMTSRVARSMPTGNVLQYLEWWAHGSRWPLEIIAARSNIDLPDAEPLAAEPTPYDAVAKSLVEAIRALPADGGFATYERGATADLAEFVGRASRYGPHIYKQDKAEIEAFLNTSFDSLEAADAALETFVTEAGSEEDAGLVPLLYRRVQRHCQLFEPFLTRPSVANQMKTFAQLMAS